MSENDNSSSRPVSVGVIIATHNQTEWLDQAVKSALVQQTDRISVKCFVVDNGSNAKTREYLSNWVGEVWTIGRILPLDNNITQIHENSSKCLMISNKPLGPSRARNIAIKEALMKGCDYVAILDSDDYWLEGKLSQSIEILENNPKIGSVYTDNLRLYEDGRTDREFRPSFSLDSLLQYCYIHSGSVIRAKIFEEVGGYNEEMRTAEDWDLWLRIAKRYLIRHIPEPLVVARIHSSNSTNSVDMSVWQENWKRIGDRIRSLYAT